LTTKLTTNIPVKDCSHILSTVPDFITAKGEVLVTSTPITLNKLNHVIADPKKTSCDLQNCKT